MKNIKKKDWNTKKIIVKKTYYIGENLLKIIITITKIK
jgi:hypothetical protein